MSEQQAEQTSAETGSLDAGQVPNSTETQGAAASAQPSVQETASVDAPRLVPEQGETGEAVKMDAPKAEMPKVETIKVETIKAETANAEPSRDDAPRAPGKIMIMSSADRGWGGNAAGPEPKMEQSPGISGKRQIAAMAAMVMLAVTAGAFGGALATVGFAHFPGEGAATGSSHVIEAAVARIDADIQALKIGVEHTSKIGMSQFNKTSERLDKVEKTQAEPAARLARLSEAVDKLRAAPAAAAVPVAAAPAPAKEVTGSIAPAAAAPASAPAKPEVARLPTLEGWVIRDIGRGGALIEGRRRGIFEVYAGDEIPGLGRIDAVRKQDGHWVVVTSKGLIVAR